MWDESKCTLCEQVGLEIGALIPQVRLELDVATVVGRQVEVEHVRLRVLLEVRKRDILQPLFPLNYSP